MFHLWYEVASSSGYKVCFFLSDILHVVKCQMQPYIWKTNTLSWLQDPLAKLDILSNLPTFFSQVQFASSAGNVIIEKWLLLKIANIWVWKISNLFSFLPLKHPCKFTWTLTRKRQQCSRRQKQCELQGASILWKWDRKQFIYSINSAGPKYCLIWQVPICLLKAL